MLLSLALVAAVTTMAPPPLITAEPATKNAKLLDALQRAEDDFKSVQRELGLLGSAPLAGLKADKSVARQVVGRPRSPRVQKAALKSRS